MFCHPSQGQVVLLDEDLPTVGVKKEAKPVYIQLGPIPDITKLIAKVDTDGLIAKYLAIGPHCMITVSNYKRTLPADVKKVVKANSVDAGLSIFTAIGPAKNSAMWKMLDLVKGFPKKAYGAFNINKKGFAIELFFPQASRS